MPFLLLGLSACGGVDPAPRATQDACKADARGGSLGIRSFGRGEETCDAALFLVGDHHQVVWQRNGTYRLCTREGTVVAEATTLAEIAVLAPELDLEPFTPKCMNREEYIRISRWIYEGGAQELE